MFSVVAPFVDRELADLDQEVESDPAAVFGRELDVVAVALGPGHAAPAVSCLTWSSVIRSFFFMWIGDVAMNTWMRGSLGVPHRLPARSTSLNAVRDSPAMIEPRTALAIASTASKSPWLAIGNPASITSTPRRASCSAISSFSTDVE